MNSTANETHIAAYGGANQTNKANRSKWRRRTCIPRIRPELNVSTDADALGVDRNLTLFCNDSSFNRSFPAVKVAPYLCL